MEQRVNDLEIVLNDLVRENQELRERLRVWDATAQIHHIVRKVEKSCMERILPGSTQKPCAVVTLRELMEYLWHHGENEPEASKAMRSLLEHAPFAIQAIEIIKGCTLIDEDDEYIADFMHDLDDALMWSKS